ncbi:hypothetical protein BB561_006751 [Smittium simulii]|uniref:Actin cytoskeleton-regulatory complex protein SLA1 n=1 Tax=Smittium simulii TaxID=133385 RepID=A0A2T9Y1V1_9FUNG|nr:hypothetical protein BB561_006751 [Smittium simulii]
MPFLRISRAVYDYSAQDNEELSIGEGDIFFVLGEPEPGWYLAKPRPSPDQDSSISQGLIPASYLEDITPVSKGVALYDYQAIDQDETSLTEDEPIDIIDNTDSDWFIVKSQDGVGYAPASYIEALQEKPKPSKEHIDPHTPAKNVLDNNIPDSVAISDTLIKSKQDSTPNNLAPTTLSIPPPPPPPPVFNTSTQSLASKSNNVSNPPPISSIPQNNINSKNYNNSPKKQMPPVLNKSQQIFTPSVTSQNSSISSPFKDNHAAKPNSVNIKSNNENLNTKKIFATILYNFVGDGKDEISVQKSQTVEYLSDMGGGWSQIKVEIGNSKFDIGIVPTTFLSINDITPNLDSSSKPNLNLTDESNKKLITAAELIKSQRITDTSSSTKPKKNTFEQQKNIKVDLGDGKSTIEGIKMWSDSTGSFAIEARFMYLKDDGIVHLVKTNGNEVHVPFDKLSSKDQTFIKSEMNQQSQKKPVYKKPWRSRKGSNFDWFDFFTLKAHINADKALRYDTSFTEEGLDQQSMSELLEEKNNETLKSLGVNNDDIPAIISAFEKQLGVKSLKSTNTTQSNAKNNSESIDDTWQPKSKLKPVISSKNISSTQSQQSAALTTLKPVVNSFAAVNNSKSNPNSTISSQNKINKPSLPHSSSNSTLKSSEWKLLEQEKKLKAQEDELKKTKTLLEQQNKQLAQINQTIQVEEQLELLKIQNERQRSENQRKDLLSQQALVSQQQKQLDEMRKAIEENKKLFEQHQSVIKASTTINSFQNVSKPATTSAKLMEPLAATRIQKPFQPTSLFSSPSLNTLKPVNSLNSTASNNSSSINYSGLSNQTSQSKPNFSAGAQVNFGSIPSNQNFSPAANSISNSNTGINSFSNQTSLFQSQQPVANKLSNFNTASAAAISASGNFNVSNSIPLQKPVAQSQTISLQSQPIQQSQFVSNFNKIQVSSNSPISYQSNTNTPPFGVSANQSLQNQKIQPLFQQNANIMNQATIIRQNSAPHTNINQIGQFQKSSTPQPVTQHQLYQTQYASAHVPSQKPQQTIISQTQTQTQSQTPIYQQTLSNIQGPTSNQLTSLYSNSGTNQQIQSQNTQQLQQSAYQQQQSIQQTTYQPQSIQHTTYQPQSIQQTTYQPHVSTSDCSATNIPTSPQSIQQTTYQPQSIQQVAFQQQNQNYQQAVQQQSYQQPILQQQPNSQQTFGQQQFTGNPQYSGAMNTNAANVGTAQNSVYPIPQPIQMQHQPQPQQPQQQSQQTQHQFSYYNHGQNRW